MGGATATTVHLLTRHGSKIDVDSWPSDGRRSRSAVELIAQVAKKRCAGIVASQPPASSTEVRRANPSGESDRHAIV